MGGVGVLCRGSDHVQNLKRLAYITLIDRLVAIPYAGAGQRKRGRENVCD